MKLIQERLIESFEKFSSKIAIEYGSESITYSELNDKSNKIMQFMLHHYGNEKGNKIGVSMNNRLHFIISFIGILRAGFVFVPLEPSFPSRRITNMIQSADIVSVLCDDDFLQKNIEKKEGCTFVDFKEIIGTENDKSMEVTYEQEDPIYIYYTSGSTGEPKPVLGKNLGLTHFIAWEIHTFQIDDSYRFSQLTNVGFDVFLRDILVALSSGACLCIPEKKEIMLESSSLSNWLNTQRINFVHCVPSLFALLNHDNITEEDYKDLKYILLAGEKIVPEKLHNWYEVMKERVELVNLYGPTETTLAKLFYRMKAEDSSKSNMPVGKPIDGAQVFVLNEDMKLCDILETGDVYIRTPFKTLGYYKKEELTKQVFLPYTFENGVTDIIYKTGDIGRILPDDNLELLGRKDRQVKIRGMRIELEEIEQAILKHVSIKDAVVIMKELSSKSQVLYAYVTKQEDVLEDEDLRSTLLADLEEELPQYMIPADIVVMDEIPKMLNGKIDYSNLKALLDVRSEVIEPRNEIESILVGIWKSILGIDIISIDDSFFEKGGNSLSLMNLILCINDTFHVEMNFEDITLENTIEKQALFIQEAKEESVKQIPVADKKNSYHILESQKRFYFLQQKDKDSCLLNLASVTKITGNLNVARLEKALGQVVKYQENLRAYFKVEDNDIKQLIADDITVKIEKFTLGAHMTIQEKVKELIRPFNLNHPPLFRGFLCEAADKVYYLIFDVHHIIFDGYSNEILVRNLAAFYKNEQVEDLDIQFKDYAEFANTPEQIEKMKEHEAFWLQEFRKEVKSLKLPEKMNREELNYNVSVEEFIIDGELFSNLHATAKKNDTTLFTVLLTGFYILLSSIGNEDDITIGIPVSGRGYAKLNNIIGMFVNTIAFRQYPNHTKTCKQFLLEVKNGFIKAMENQNYLYNDLVSKLVQDKKLNGDSLFDVMFQMQNYGQEIIFDSEIEIERVAFNGLNEYKLNFSISEHSSHLKVSVLYLSEILDKEFIKQLLEQYKKILCTLNDDLQTEISQCIKSSEDNAILLDVDFQFD